MDDNLPGELKVAGSEIIRLNAEVKRLEALVPAQSALLLCPPGTPAHKALREEWERLGGGVMDEPTTTTTTLWQLVHPDKPPPPVPPMWVEDPPATMLPRRWLLRVEGHEDVVFTSESGSPCEEAIVVGGLSAEADPDKSLALAIKHLETGGAW